VDLLFPLVNTFSIDKSLVRFPFLLSIVMPDFLSEVFFFVVFSEI